jgi:DNA replication protein DnaC
MDSMANEFHKLSPKSNTSPASPLADFSNSTIDQFDAERSRKLACGLDPLDAAPKENFTWFNPSLHQTPTARAEAVSLVTAFDEWAHRIPKHPFLTIHGGVGIGKSELAKTAVWKLTPEWHDRHSYYITAADFDKRVKDFASVANQASTVSVDPDVWVERLAGAEALVLDDVGAGYIDKGWTQSRLERLIDLRYRYKLPTAIISNLSPANLRVELGERAYSRLTDKAIGKVLTLENLSDVRQIERTQEGK